MAKVLLFLLFVGNGEQSQRHTTLGIPACFDGREFCGLMVARVQAVLIADDHLKRDENGQQPQRHRQHDSPFFGRVPSPDEIGADAEHDETAGNKEADNDVRQPVGEGRVEDHLEPVL